MLTIAQLGIGLKDSSALKFLTVGDTLIDSASVAEFLGRYAENCVLDVLDCRQNPAVSAGESSDEFRRALARHNKLTVLYDKMD